MDGQRAVFEPGMLAQHLLLFRAPTRSKRYMNIPPGLACGRGLALDSGGSATPLRLTHCQRRQVTRRMAQIGFGQSMNKCSRANRRAR
ncbi:hypothetical protein CYL20_21740 [Pseudomonas palleroniana]|uniref:Uncharacterized protein n=1 Tax=Pseudomonas palleroniana TaxID=191390 RepID=A0A2L1JF17_9PSED|nr:hypothetical protein CYL20_21740 [Pseudomonas palleroniana]